MTKHFKNWKISQFEELSKVISDYKIIGIGDLENFPTDLLQKLKKNLSDVKFKVTKRNVLKRVLDEKGHKDLAEKLPNQPILILTNDNAFDLYLQIKKSKAKSKAKIGMISTVDVVVPEGDTGLPPGPALSDLKKVGIKVQVKGPTIYVTKDAVIAKVGEVISKDVVNTLSKLDIKPFELILNIVGIKEGNLIYSKEVLDVDSNDVYNKFINAVRCSINLGVEIGYVTKMTIETMVMMAELKAKALQTEVDNKNGDKK